jgi:peptide/nickel transport system substrate-binding protein
MIIDAGYPDGIMGVEIAAVSREQNYVIMATMTAAYWNAIGVETTVRPMETTAHTAYVNSGDYQTTAAWANTSLPFRLLEGEYIPPSAEMPNDARYDNPYFTERYWEAAETVDSDARNAILKEIGLIAIDDLPILPIFGPSWATSWWPWVRNFYGEMEVSTYDPSTYMAYAWLDEDLKEDLGY